MYNMSIHEDMEFLRARLLEVNLLPYTWDGEDKNIGAFRSKAELVTWYSQSPGVLAEPYRDRGFYCRELAMVSRILKPRSIVEFGTSTGIGTCLLQWLNPMARLVTVDVNVETFLPSGPAEMGVLAKFQRIPAHYITMKSWEYWDVDVEFCFIDAEHTYEAVLKDSERAWHNRRVDKWCIAWHDYNDRHPGVVHAVLEFCMKKKVDLQLREDSDTVWIMRED